MSDIQKEIKEALKESEGISLSNFHLATREQGKAHDKVRNNAHTWLLHLLELIEKLQEELRVQRKVTEREKHYADSLQKDIEQKNAEIARLRQALTSERDEAMKWDGIGTVSRINKVLKGADTCAP